MSRGIITIARLVGLLLIAVATRYALDRWALVPLRCVHAASLGQVSLEDAVQRGDAEARLVARRVRADLDGCGRVSPPVVAIPVTLGAALEASGDSRAAVAEYERVLRIDRRPEIYLRLGLAQLNAFDRAGALDNLTRACTFKPALLAEIPYKEVRLETRERIIAAYGADWLVENPRALQRRKRPDRNSQRQPRSVNRRETRDRNDVWVTASTLP